MRQYEHRIIDGRPISEWSRETGVPASIIYSRYFEGKWDAYRAIHQPVKPKNIKVVYKGKEYSSISKLAKEVGIAPKTLGERIRKGFSVEEACTTMRMPKQSNRRDPYQSIKCPHKDCFTCPFPDCMYGD